MIALILSLFLALAGLLLAWAALWLVLTACLSILVFAFFGLISKP